MAAELELVTVLETGDEAAIVIAKSLLEEAGIDYLVEHEGLHALFPLRQYRVHFQVRRADEEEAGALLESLRS